MTRKVYKENYLDYVFNWIYAGGSIGKPFDTDKKFIAWLRSMDISEEDIDGIIRSAYRFDNDIYRSAQKYLAD